MRRGDIFFYFVIKLSPYPENEEFLIMLRTETGLVMHTEQNFNVIRIWSVLFG